MKSLGLSVGEVFLGEPPKIRDNGPVQRIDVVVQFLQHKHRQVDIMFFKAEQAGRIVHQHIGVQYGADHSPAVCG